MEKAMVYKAGIFQNDDNVVSEEAYNKLWQAYNDLKAYNQYLDDFVIDIKNKQHLQDSFKEFVNDL